VRVLLSAAVSNLDAAPAQGPELRLSQMLASPEWIDQSIYLADTGP
jgi:hypothetical protein